MFTATVWLAFAGDFEPTLRGGSRRFYTGNASAISKSPAKALAQARAKALRQCGDGAAYTPIIDMADLRKDGKIIYKHN